MEIINDGKRKLEINSKTKKKKKSWPQNKIPVCKSNELQTQGFLQRKHGCISIIIV